MASHVRANVGRFSGFADVYDAHRPTPPSIIVDILTQLADIPRPALVVDLGCGTGLSTRIWAGRADRVLGIEPNPDMRRQAETATGDLGRTANIVYRDGLASSTGLPDGAADIVTCSQCLHWLEPVSTFAEVARVLRPGGVFAAYDCDWPPTMDWQMEVLHADFMKKVRALEEQHGVYKSVKKWDKEQHLARIKTSGHFRYAREVLVHSVESGNADRLIGLARSFGGVADLQKKGLTDKDIGLDLLEDSARRRLGNTPRPWYFSYRIRVAVK